MTKRDINRELLDSVRAIKKGRGHKFTVSIPEDVKEIRIQLTLSQTEFATFLGVSVRTLQNWEQGRRHPSGPALALLKIAHLHPRVFLQR